MLATALETEAETLIFLTKPLLLFALSSSAQLQLLGLISGLDCQYTGLLRVWAGPLPADSSPFSSAFSSVHNQ